MLAEALLQATQHPQRRPLRVETPPTQTTTPGATLPQETRALQRLAAKTATKVQAKTATKVQAKTATEVQAKTATEVQAKTTRPIGKGGIAIVY